MNLANPYIRSFAKLSANSPTGRETLTLRTLIVLGVLYLLGFIIWFISHISIGQPTFFWLLCFAFIFRILRVLHDWYNYFQIKRIVTPLVGTKIKTVDVLTTYFPGEPKEMTKNTLLAMKNIRYPHENYLCDEANDEELRDFCKANGIHHATRNSRKDAKAGNINNALQTAVGEFCFILDPDHVPHPDLLDGIITHFEDPDIGFIQIVQGYYNANNSFIATGASQQTYQFYGPTMMSMGQQGTAQAIGANCCFRRKALDSIGGHAPGLAEDLHTSMLLHAKGWKSKYVPEVLTRGLVPEDFHGYFKQQLKWSKGSFDLFFRVLPRILTKLSWRHKLHYALQPQYYLFGVVNLIEILVPICSLLFFIVPWEIDMIGFLLALTPFVGFSLIIHLYVQKWVLEKEERGLHFLGGVLRKATWFIYTIGLLFSVLKIHVRYLPTPKENKVGGQLKLVIPNLMLALISLFAIIYGLNHDLTPFSMFMAGFASINFTILFFSGFLAFPFFNLKKESAFKKLAVLQFAKYANSYLGSVKHYIYDFIREKSILTAIIISILPLSLLYFTRPSNLIVRVKAGDFFLRAHERNNLSSGSNTKIIPIEINATTSIADHEWSDEDGYLFFQLDLERGSDALFDSIRNGNYNQMIYELCTKLKTYHEPFFISLKFAPDLLKDDIITNRETSLRIKSAYYHFLELFKDNNCHNAIWVWQVSSKANGEFLMPTHDNYDWRLIRITDSNLSDYIDNTQLADVVTVKPTIVDATAINADILTPQDLEDLSVQWNVAGLITQQEIKESGHGFNSRLASKKKINPVIYQASTSASSMQNVLLLDTIRGICYDPYDLDIQSTAILSKKRLDADFDRVRSIGANCVRVYASDTYLQNILSSSRRFGLKLMVDTKIPNDLDFYSDINRVKSLQRKLQKTITKYRTADPILFWNVGDDVIGRIEHHFAKPYSQKVINAYFLFLNELAGKIYETDPHVNLVFSTPFSLQKIEQIEDHISLLGPNVFIGLNVFYDQHFQVLREKLSTSKLASRVLISAYGPDGYWDPKLSQRSILQQPLEMNDFDKAQEYIRKWNNYLKDHNLAIPGGFAYRWKDHPNDLTTWMGITSAINTKKLSYYALKSLWLHEPNAITLTPNYNLIYNGYRIMSGMPDASFQITRDLKILNSDEHIPEVKWILSIIPNNGVVINRFLGFGVSQQLPEDLPEGQYRMHVYISDSVSSSISLSAPFAIIN